MRGLSRGSLQAHHRRAEPSASPGGDCRQPARDLRGWQRQLVQLAGNALDVPLVREAHVVVRDDVLRLRRRRADRLLPPQPTVGGNCEPEMLHGLKPTRKRRIRAGKEPTPAYFGTKRACFVSTGEVYCTDVVVLAQAVTALVTTVVRAPTPAEIATPAGPAGSVISPVTAEVAAPRATLTAFAHPESMLVVSV